MDISKLTRKEKLALLNKAKDAYYNTGEEILSDWEYDELEKELGLENSNYVGSRNGNYTVKHAFLMGSLAKIQIRQDKNGIIDWGKYAQEFTTYFNKARSPKWIETTPKLDGCSFSAQFTVTGNSYKLLSCATRGDGNMGSDITRLFKPMLNTDYWSKINEACVNILDEGDILCIRGEILIPYSIFDEKYAIQNSTSGKSYTNPRSFVSGQVGQQQSNEFDTEAASDLHFVCYDYRIVDTNGKYYELSWMNPNDKTYSILKPYLNHIGELPPAEYCKVYPYSGKFTEDDIADIYALYDRFRVNESEYALDGVVFKPEVSARQYNIDRERPVDCVAMKYLPTAHKTEIIDIIWQTKKTNEYKPIAILKPIILDGKKIQKATLHNYNDIIKKECGIGSIVEVDLAGDIIPRISSVIKPAGAENINLPADAEIVKSDNGTYKLMKVYEDDDSQYKDKFLASANELKINHVGPAAAGALWKGLHGIYDNLTNILAIMHEDGYNNIYKVFGKSKSIDNIVNSLREYAKTITVYDIIRSCCIPGCRDKSAQVCAKILMGLPYDTKSINRASYQWALDPNSSAYDIVMSYIEQFGISLDNAAEEMETEITTAGEKIPIVMTGSPKAFGYKTKSEFLNAHPEYTDVGSSIKDCKILFTDDLNSTSSKMKQAAKYGVEIKLYECFSF